MNIYSSKRCMGYRVELQTRNKTNAIYRVNFLPKIVDNAPPEGFSVYDSKAKEFQSLGVDENLRVLRVSSLYLDPSTKIYNKNDGRVVRWRFVMDTPNIVKKITINSENQKITLKKLDSNECGIVYDYLATQPAYGKEVWEDKVVNFSTFNDWCINKWQIYQENSLVEKLFDTKDKSVKNLAIAELLERGRNIVKKPSKECQIEVGLLYPSHSIDPLWDGEFVVRKLNKEPFEIKAKGGRVTVNKGVYVIYILDKNLDGTSEVINCKGGKVHTLVKVNPHI